MLKRVMVAVIWIPVLLVIFLLCPPVCLVAAVAAISAVAMHEILWRAGYVKHIRLVVYAILMAAAIPFWAYLGSPVQGLVGGLLVMMLLLFGEAMASGQTITFEEMGCTLFAAVLIPICLASFVRMRIMDHGIFYILMPLVSAFTSDAFALFAGMLFGKHKLAPVLSPKKTVEGSVGGFVGAVVCMCLYGLVLQLGWSIQPNYLVLAGYGILASAVSQVGDLSFSYIKRLSGIKDYGVIFPGHGGVLDRFDSVIFCAPLTELALSVLPFFLFS